LFFFLDNNYKREEIANLKIVQSKGTDQQSDFKGLERRKIINTQQISNIMFGYIFLKRKKKRI
jgi:hypothetical protein